MIVAVTSAMVSCSTVLEWGKERGKDGEEGSRAVVEARLGRAGWSRVGTTPRPYRVLIRMFVFRADSLFLQLFLGTF